ncbi:NAD(P)/FAD-dependent oxidoreductase [Caulobacter sp. 17J80-11]|uniref:NAD(P)/FAD-dependent oxidoreductase n=1 Tax=Caulobacter sp. 17J80-11 TaxID=2763502 RepID=UPI001653E859|nr:NAD(P)/FAD-dependent oxidoreductase [Caulobacter sp. 17J80-11]MBC6981874.1 NAD(P)/FAD-dependent oxidoreductase [Caulobacter sp. 17J80-11]
MTSYDVVVIGAGAAGMMCAAEAGKRGRRALIVDHADKPGEKIRISGGGRCNFTNLRASPAQFLSANPRFCISALSRYTQHDFLKLVERYGIAWHEKTLGQLFCDDSAKQIIDMMLAEMRAGGVELRLGTSVTRVAKADDGFEVSLSSGQVRCRSLVVATGGKSIPKMGATGFGYDLAQYFGLRLVETRPALVPLTFEVGLLERLKPLAGVAVDPTVIGAGKTRFEEAMLFTHRGLSGPAVLQISSYWREGQEIVVDMAPGVDLFEALRAARRERARQALVTVLSDRLPRRLAQHVVETEDAATGNVGDLSDKVLRRVADAVNAWRVKPVGSEGYRTAEVTLGGVDTRDLDSKTMAARDVPGLYFIGEVVDVTGWLGGYNFQWAWSSGWVAGQTV